MLITGFIRIFILILLSLPAYSQIAINTNGTPPDSSAMLDVQSADRGVLIPRMTASQRTIIYKPATGLLVYQTDGHTGFYYNSGTASSPAWLFLGGHNAATPKSLVKWDSTGNYLIPSALNEHNGKVGLGTTQPITKLHIVATNGTGFTLADGTQGENKTLICNEFGVANWQTSSKNSGFSVYTTANQDVANSVYQKINFNEKVFDGENAFNTTTGTYIAPVFGVYQFNLSATLGGFPTNSCINTLLLYQNGFPIKSETSGTSIYDATLSCNFTVQCAAGDQITGYIYHCSGPSRTVRPGPVQTNFSGFRVY